MPNISFIITTYNYSRYLEECLDSILNQDQYEGNKIIIIDDGSQDDTYKVIKHRLSIPSIEYIQIENSGIEIASNYAISKINSEYFTRVDADDSLKSEYLSRVNEEIKLHKNTDFFYSDYNVINQLSEFIQEINLPSFDREEIFNRGDFLATGTLYKKESIDLIDKYDTSIKNCGLENYSLILRLLIKGYEGIHIPSSLFNYRIHSDNMSKKRRLSILKYGNELTTKLLGMPYAVNCYHPYGLKID